MLGLDFNTGGIIPFYDEAQDDVVVNGPHVELERQRIRAFVKAVCEKMGKPFEACRNAFLLSLPKTNFATLKANMVTSGIYQLP
ncbi:MAG: hypothetical protein E6969_00415 [Veillonella sp.]|nr:hypothetical protein [Veillonella sp.]